MRVPHSPEWRRLQAEVARNLRDDQRRGMVTYPARQRTILITFGSNEEAEAWDELSDEDALGVLITATSKEDDDETNGNLP